MQVWTSVRMLDGESLWLSTNRKIRCCSEASKHSHAFLTLSHPTISLLSFFSVNFSCSLCIPDSWSVYFRTTMLSLLVSGHQYFSVGRKKALYFYTHAQKWLGIFQRTFPHLWVKVLDSMAWRSSFILYRIFNFHESFNSLRNMDYARVVTWIK